MSSGKPAEPPALGEERTSFDLSRRSEQEVAAEVAAQLAAWKQARAGANAEPQAVATKRPTAIGPIQPPRLAFLGGYARAASSAAMRAMPPAPSLRPNAPRADPKPEAPHMEAPRIEIAEWDMPLPVSRTHAPPPRRTGAGWAIGLGALLLILGVTSPAAVWQQWRDAMLAALDRAVSLDPVALPAPAGDSGARQGEAADNKGEIAPSPDLTTVPEGGELAAAPVSKPPPRGPAEEKSPPHALVTHPFRPEQAASLLQGQPVAAPPSAPKPYTAPAANVAVSAPPKAALKPATRNNELQSPGGLFETLLDTLAAGQPADSPSSKPIHPSNRR